MRGVLTYPKPALECCGSRGSDTSNAVFIDERACAHSARALGEVWATEVEEQPKLPGDCDVSSSLAAVSGLGIARSLQSNLVGPSTLSASSAVRDTVDEIALR